MIVFKSLTAGALFAAAPSTQAVTPLPRTFAATHQIAAPRPVPGPLSAVAEPAPWAMIAGVILVGVMRRRNRSVAA